jgi:hypothetical protein
MAEEFAEKAKTEDQNAESVRFHFDVHLHLAVDPSRQLYPDPRLTGAALAGYLPPGGHGSNANVGGARSLFSIFVICGLLGFVGVFAYKASGGGGGTPSVVAYRGSEPYTPPVERRLAAAQQPAVLKELEEAPRVTPPPGAAPAGAPSGPRVFGLD